MKTQWLIPVILGAAVCLTGCGRCNDLTIQEDMIPVVPVDGRSCSDRSYGRNDRHGIGKD